MKNNISRATINGNVTTRVPTGISYVDSNATIENTIFLKPGKWRKSMAKKSTTLRGSSIVEGRRMTMQLADYQASQTLVDVTNKTIADDDGPQSEMHNVSLQQFHTPVVSMKTVTDQCYLRLKSARNEVFQRCGQQEPISFEQMVDKLQITIKRKIGEGVYGEVFLCIKANGEQCVLKLIPIEGSMLINGERQKTFEEILSEVIITAELSNLRQRNVQFSTDGFVELRNVSCVMGQYPSQLVDLWRDYNKKHGSENDSPEEFSQDQQYIVFETAYGGTDLDSFRFKNANEMFSIFTQIVLTLAIAEQRYDFEHRDLHTGNILIERTKEKQRNFYLLGEEIVIQTHKLKATIIDYTLSRVVYNGLCLFNDLSTEEELFTAEGDYQFEIYRSMKTVLKNEWNVYSPKTNVHWLHYLLDKLICNRSSGKVTQDHKAVLQSMKDLRDVLLEFNSAHEIVQNYITSPAGDAHKENSKPIPPS
ncbi:serine/threonine-protein kinase haspin homolog [Anopheles nili]|uniref:serine/threonine-protein kinase haspin homolog n=1 Tax=Anopheles nili TaxID=185578 RepID=UPI00237B2C1B|nr:serine/threonine-protein kinase haspin homolog [Anopheles nili]